MSLKLAMYGGLLLFLGILLSLLGYYHNKAKAQGVEITQLMQEKNEAQLIITTQIQQISDFNKISKAEQDEKQQVVQQSNERIVYIRTAAKANRCSMQPVPVDVVNRLREHANQIRQGSAGADTGQPAGRVPAAGH